MALQVDLFPDLAAPPPAQVSALPKVARKRADLHGRKSHHVDRRLAAWRRLRSSIEGAIEDLRNEVPGLPCQETAGEVDIHLDLFEEVITSAIATFGEALGDEDGGVSLVARVRARIGS